MQPNNQVKLIIVPAITRSKLRPVSAISSLLCLTPKVQIFHSFRLKMLKIGFPLLTVE